MLQNSHKFKKKTRILMNSCIWKAPDERVNPLQANTPSEWASLLFRLFILEGSRPSGIVDRNRTSVTEGWEHLSDEYSFWGSYSVDESIPPGDFCCITVSPSRVCWKCHWIVNRRLILCPDPSPFHVFWIVRWWDKVTFPPSVSQCTISFDALWEYRLLTPECFPQIE